MMLHLPRKAFSKSADALRKLVAAARAEGAHESSRLLGALLSAYVEDGRVSVDVAFEAMGAECSALADELIERARRARPLLPESYSYATVPPDAPHDAGAIGADAEMAAVAAAARTETPHGLFTVRAGYVDPVTKHRASAQPKPSAAQRVAMAGGGGAGGSAEASRPAQAQGRATQWAQPNGTAACASHRPGQASSGGGASATRPASGAQAAGAQPACAGVMPPPGDGRTAAQVAAAAARRAAANAPKKRTMVVMDDAEASAMRASNSNSKPGEPDAKQRKRCG
jgi:hypothetical protein